MTEGKFYGAETFNPRMIVTQIVVMQSAFYICFCGFVASADFIVAEPQSLSQLFSSQAYNWNTPGGQRLVASLWGTSLVMVFALRMIVERAKKCLDFVATYHLFHLVATCYASNFPSAFRWWAIHGIAVLIATLIGEYVCMMGETKAIKIGGKQSHPSYEV